MQMLRLNIRHELPQITIRNHHGKLDKNAYVPAQPQTENQQARSNKTVSQPSIQMDSYQSRRDYGARNLTDLTREFGQKGLSDVKANRSRTTQIAWERAESGGKPGDDIKQQYKNQIHAEAPRTLVEFDLMEGLQIYYTPAQVVGESELSNIDLEFEPTPFADVHFKPGNLNVYLQNEGFIRRWVTMNEYDIYA